MGKLRLFSLPLIALAICATAWFSAQAQGIPQEEEEDVAPRLERFDLKDIDGLSVALSDEAFGGVDSPKPIAFCFINPWSYPALAQAKLVLAAADAFSGQLVIVCAGNEREIRAIAQQLDPLVDGERKALWLRGATSVSTDFGKMFTPDWGITQLKAVPALLVVDATRKASFTSFGEASEDAILAALASTETASE